MDEEDFKASLNPEQYRVMRKKGTETPFTGKYWDSTDKGTYTCAACGSALFSSNDKFDAGTGWPSFRKPIDEKNFEFKQEHDADQKVEVRCKKCKSHLGYIVIEGDLERVGEPKKMYYRVNSICLDFEEQEGHGLGELKENVENVQDTKEKTRYTSNSLRIKIASKVETQLFSKLYRSSVRGLLSVLLLLLWWLFLAWRLLSFVLYLTLLPNPLVQLPLQVPHLLNSYRWVLPHGRLLRTARQK